METLDRTEYAAASNCDKGGYMLVDCEGTPDVILMGSGSELGLCTEAATRLADRESNARVVSMPCMELFADQTAVLSGPGAAAERDPSRRCRSRNPHELGSLARLRRQVRRHGRLRGQRPLCRGLRALRHQRGCGCQSGEIALRSRTPEVPAHRDY